MKLFTYVILLAFIASSCCSLCKVETITEHTIDTVFVADTVEVELFPEALLNRNNELEITLANQNFFIDSLLAACIKEALEIEEVPQYEDIFYVYIDTVYAETKYAIAHALINPSCDHQKDFPKILG